MKKLLCLLFVLAGFCTKAQEVLSISGTVTDEKGMTIPGATVFITNSKYGTATNSEGKFSFSNVQPGTYEVIAKLLGFSPAIKSITVNEKSVNITLRLKESNTVLKAVTINGGPDINREKYLEQFTKYFIGETVNAGQCKLLNPEVLNFHYNKTEDVLTADADDFLIVENKALGYTIKYLLKEFKIDFKNAFSVNTGFPYFEELKGNKTQQDVWQNNRRLAYLNSPRHFFKAIMNNTATDEGYSVYQIPPKANRKTLDAIRPLKLDSLFATIDKNFKVLTLTTGDNKLPEIYVVYTGADEPELFHKTDGVIDLPIKLPSRKRQVSKMQLFTSTIIIDKNGALTPSDGLKYSGYWAWGKIADLTPLDYFVEPAKHTNELEKGIQDPALKGIIATIDTARKRLPVEKLYLQLDKPYYALGDTIRFKAYLLDGDRFMPVTRSRLLYVELDNTAGSMVKRIMVPLESGVSWGDIALSEKELSEGSYTLRAYTNWMRNFGDDYIFKKNIYVSALTPSMLVKADFKLENTGEKNKVRADLHFTGLDKNPIRLKNMQLKLMDGAHNLFKDNLATGIDGRMETNFDLADKTGIKNLVIQARQTDKGANTATLTIPVALNRADKTDLQFMPEGGNLVAGIKTKIGFKAIGEDGKGVTVNGKIYDSKQQEITTFQSAHAGMGVVELTPQTGENYTAKLTLPNGATKTYPLQAVNATGTTLKVVTKGNDSLSLTLNISASLLNTAPTVTYYLLGQAKGVVYYAAPVNFKEPVVTKTIDKALFPAGIVHFTLLNQTGQPLNERIAYIDNKDNLQFTIQSNKPNYDVRDSVALTITVKDKNGKPVQGTFSLAVTDDSQVKTDSTGSNILNNLLLTSDLKGNVEEPGYYLENETSQRVAELDNLLLTQGWVGYNWKNTFAAKTLPQYPAEAEYTVQGKVTNIFNKPVEKSNVVLLSPKLSLAKDTVTDKDGRFIFKGLYPVDTAVFKLFAKNKRGKSDNVSIEMLNEFNPPAFTTNGATAPWYLNNDVVLLNNTKAARLQADANLRGQGHLLKQVEIKDKKIIKGSHNLNGPGEADQVLDEADMAKAGKMTLEDLLTTKIKGFHIRGNIRLCDNCGIYQSSYVIDNELVIYIIDGVNVNQLYDGYSVIDPTKDPERSTFLKSFLGYYTAEDIKGIEVLSSGSHKNTYYSTYIDNFTFQLGHGDMKRHELSPTPILNFVEITTRAGKGPLTKLTPGTFLYKPLPFTIPKEFYRPRYTVKNSGVAVGTDLRSTIHWEPNVGTNAAGQSTITFFSADKPTDYTLTLEGTDLNGNIGYKRQKIKVVQK